MSVKKRLIASIIVMIVIQAALILILSELLICVFTFANPDINLFAADIFSLPQSYMTRFVLIWAAMVIFVMIAGGFFINYYISRVMLKPVADLTEALEHMKNGDLNYEFVGSGDGELNALCASFEELRLQLQRNIKLGLKRENEQKMLLANISHDIKTPITSIKGYVDGIIDGVADTPEKREHYLGTIYAKADIIEQMVENLSIYSKLELGRLHYNREETDIFGFLSDTADKFALDLQNAEMELSVNIPSERVYVMADGEKLRRVFSNIITNAIKYKKPGAGALTISAENTENGVFITFADEGIGIAEKDIPHIFDGFYRGDPSRTSAVDGNGLGLSISRRIVNDHGGKIWLRSRDGCGTEVIMRLPVKRTETVGRACDEDIDC